MARNELILKDVTKRFGGLTAVDALSFKVEDGQIYGIIGPNGAGKTTAIGIISSLVLVAFAAGALAMDGRAHAVCENGQHVVTVSGWYDEQFVEPVVGIRILRQAIGVCEPEAYLPHEGFLRQFDGRPLDGELSLRTGIQGIAGSTFTANAVTAAVRRVLAIHRSSLHELRDVLSEELKEEFGDPFSCFFVKVSRRFIGQQELRLHHQGAGDGNPLLLAAR